MRRTIPCLLLGIALVLAGCQPPAPADGTSAAGTVEDTTPAHDAGAASASAESDHAHATAAPDGESLRTIMVRLGGNMAGVTHALWLADYAELEARALAVADHPDIAPAELQRLERILGPEMADFDEADHVVHNAAIRLSDAAKARDMNAVLRELSAVQTGCVACHTRFRERLLKE